MRRPWLPAGRAGLIAPDHFALCQPEARRLGVFTRCADPEEDVGDDPFTRFTRVRFDPLSPIEDVVPLLEGLVGIPEIEVDPDEARDACFD